MTVPAIADICVLSLHDSNGDLRPVVAVSDDPDRREVMDKLVARQPAVRNPALLDVVATGMTHHVMHIGRQADEMAEDADHLQLLRALDATSGIVVPLT